MISWHCFFVFQPAFLMNFSFNVLLSTEAYDFKSIVFEPTTDFFSGRRTTHLQPKFPKTSV